jgi:serine/threonine-protein kinase
VWGAVAWGEERRPTTLGRPVLRLESLLREASPGDITLSPEAEKELRTSFEGAGLDAVAQRGVFSSQPLYVVQAAVAARLMGSHAMPTLATGADVGGGAASVDLHPTLSAIGPGAVVGGRFEILSVLGAGGMGVVYKARDRELDEVVAVKMLRPDQAGDVANSARLRDELRLARRITHPNVLRTFDLGEVAGIPFISMEYVRGVTLAHLLEHTDRLAYSAGLSVAKQLCQGLAAAHEVGVLHRDIKPANLILCPNGNVKLMDFGIARPLRRSEPGQTQQGWLVGTPKYLAPEQLRGEEPDARADVYACGVVLYEMFAGTSPFHGTSYAELVTQTLHEAPPPLSEFWPEVPPELEGIVLRCLTKNPAERYPSATALYADLGRLKA